MVKLRRSGSERPARLQRQQTQKKVAKHHETGRRGEELARSFLEKLGWTLLETNWRWGRAEIDLIGMDGDILVFVEVKTRRSEAFGRPEAFVSAKKMDLMAAAAAEYMSRINHDWEIRFDVISVVLPAGRSPRIRHLPDAFFPGL